METIINPEDFVIFIVDDIPNNLKVLRGILEPIGYEITFATSGQQTLNRLKTFTPDLILLDLMMPDMDGLQVCKIIKSDPNLQDIPIIFLTASHEKEHLVNAFEQGAVDYITKPFNKAELLTRINTHIQLKYYRNYFNTKQQQEQLINDITLSILQRENLEKILNKIVTVIQSYLQADKVIIGRFNSDYQAEIIAESLSEDSRSLLKQIIPEFDGREFKNISDIFAPCEVINNSIDINLLPSQINRFTQWEVKSEVIIPLVKNQESWGVLIVNYCQFFHQWKDDELKFLTQISQQIDIAIQYN
jgi:CheY-like chemotaxis protein